MRFLEYLQEEYIAAVKANVYSHNPISIFENPDRKEMAEIAKEERGDGCRFIINFETKKLYVFSAGLIHQEAANFLYRKRLIPSSRIDRPSCTNTCLLGIGGLDNGKMLFFSVYEGHDIDEFQSLGRFDDKWLSAWFVDRPFFKSIGIIPEETWIDYRIKSRKEPETG